MGRASVRDVKEVMASFRNVKELMDVGIRIKCSPTRHLISRGDILNFCVGVRDPGRYPEFLCGCKRLGEVS